MFCLTNPDKHWQYHLQYKALQKLSGFLATDSNNKVKYSQLQKELSIAKGGYFSTLVPNKISRSALISLVDDAFHAKKIVGKLADRKLGTILIRLLATKVQVYVTIWSC